MGCPKCGYDTPHIDCYWDSETQSVKLIFDSIKAVKQCDQILNVNFLHFTSDTQSEFPAIEPMPLHKCKECGILYTSKQAMINHAKYAHMWTCPVPECGESFKTNDEISIHKALAHVPPQPKKKEAKHEVTLTVSPPVIVDVTVDPSAALPERKDWIIQTGCCQRIYYGNETQAVEYCKYLNFIMGIPVLLYEAECLIPTSATAHSSV